MEQKNNIKPLIEAALFISGRALSLKELADICNSGNLGLIRKIAEELKSEYQQMNSAIEILESEKGYRMHIKADFEKKLLYLAPESEIPKPMLKVLAQIAYEQPIKQSVLAKEQGSRIYKYVKKLREQELVEAKKSGRTKLLTTTSKFKDYFQIKDLKALVDSKELKKEDKDSDEK